MNNYDDVPIEYTEYAPNCYKIKCTGMYFMHKLDQSILNDGHYFIQIVKNKVAYPPFIKAMPSIRLVWANTIDMEPESIPIADLEFGKNSKIFIDSLYDDLLDSFKKAKYWQIEINSPLTDLFIITSPKKPKIEIVY
jgi:hypothetical protein